jgi:hypothetical protein
MFDTASGHNDIVSTAYVLRIGLLLVFCVWWYTALGMEIGLQSERRATPVDSHHPELSGLTGYSMGTTADRDLPTDQSRVAGAHDNHLQSCRLFIVVPGLRSEIRARLMGSEGGATGYRHGGGFVRHSNLWHESVVDSNVVDSNIGQSRISNSVSWKSQRLERGGYDLTDPKHYPHTTRIFQSPRNRFKSDTVFEKTITQKPRLDRYAKNDQEMTNTNPHDFDALFPAMEYIDKSLTAVYRPEGKKVSLRYEDQRGGSLFSEITVFF